MFKLLQYINIIFLYLKGGAAEGTTCDSGKARNYINQQLKLKND